MDITLPSGFISVELDTRRMDPRIVSLLTEREKLTEKMKELDKRIMLFQKGEKR
jgi:hypothetical protein